MPGPTGLPRRDLTHLPILGRGMNPKSPPDRFFHSKTVDEDKP